MTAEERSPPSWSRLVSVSFQAIGPAGLPPEPRRVSRGDPGPLESCHRRDGSHDPGPAARRGITYPRLRLATEVGR